MKIKKKVEISEGNQSTVNYTKPFKLGMDNSDRSPKDSKNKNFSKINTNPNLNNHNATINNNKNINNNNNHNNNNNNNHTVNNSNKKNANMNYNNKGNIINKSSVNNHEVNKTNNKSSTLSNNNSAISNNKVNKNNCTINNSNNNTIKTNTKITENKKIVRNINFNTSSKSNLQENIKNISHELKPQPKTQAKEDKDKDKEKEKIVSNEKKQKKSMIQGIKILDLKNNSSIKDSENVSRELPKNKIIDISENNSSRKWPIQKTNSKIIEEDNDYFKEVANIIYENNTEPRTQIKNNVKENNDKDKDKNIKFTKGRSGQINEAKIERRFGIQNSNDNKEKVNTNENNAIKGVNNIKSNDNNYNTIATSKGAIIKNRRYSSDIILINSLKAFNELKRNSSNSKMNNDNKNNILNSHVKMNSSKNHSNFNLEFSEDKNKQKLQNQSKVSKYESISKRVIDIPKIENKEEKNDDEWDNEQYMGMRKKTYDVGLRLVKKSRFLNKAKKDNSLNNEFSSQTYVKSSDGISIAGKNEYGLKKTNQDTYLIERNINGILNFNIYGVLDGHGEDGHFASQFVSRYILHRIKTHPSLRKEDEPKQIYYKLKENGYEIIANIFVDADVQIQKEKFNVSRSGTTCVIVIQLEEHIICANTGDSRAIIVFDENRDDNLMNSKIYPLSYDCKPELPNELARIIAYGGCVERAYDVENAECGPFRVWAKDKDYPGLAMSRSIGDIDAKKIGVIPNPQIVEYTIDHSSKYLILASDGIWEFIDSEDAMKYSNKYYIRNDPIGLCHDLSKRATALWEKNDCIIDDITVLVVFF
jgi:serine/threonine protein phosphatase PrpC